MIPLGLINQVPSHYLLIIFPLALIIVIAAIVFEDRTPSLYERRRADYMRECIVKMPGWRCREIWYYTEGNR